MKVCPICKARCFDDMDTCYGCLHRFGSDAEPDPTALPGGAAPATKTPSGMPQEAGSPAPGSASPHGAAVPPPPEAPQGGAAGPVTAPDPGPAQGTPAQWVVRFELFSVPPGGSAPGVQGVQGVQGAQGNGVVVTLDPQPVGGRAQ